MTQTKTTPAAAQPLVPQTKVMKAYEILTAFSLLGIPAEKFLTLKAQHGSLDGLYNHVYSLLS